MKWVQDVTMDLVLQSTLKREPTLCIWQAWFSFVRNSHVYQVYLTFPSGKYEFQSKNFGSKTKY